MFKSVLVANRGEIACRIFRTARAMGLRAVGVYSDADAKAKHVREADEACHIGPAPAAESYLRGDKIIAAALKAGAEAIHPGYGFLSENPEFADAVIGAGLIWIGPTPAAIRAMGLKDEAKRIAEEAGVPVVPGYRGADQDVKALKAAAREIGYPVLIKAVAGGGGRGIREVSGAGEFADALASAKREALAAFGDERVIIEKLIERPRHIEVQVFGDKHGGLVHMYERDCSLQRRRQKVIEEAPAPGMTDGVRAAMTSAALKVARAVAYENAGTVEFIVGGSRPVRADGFWFLEMNTRLQVEHPVTEEVTGLDLVEWQFRVAAGEKLPRKQSEIGLNGHAIEARICAEDPSEGFRPSVGRLHAFRLSGKRADAGFDEGDVVPSAYDSLLAKLIVHGETRADAIGAAEYLTGEAIIAGVSSNLGFLRRCLRNEDFRTGDVHTGVIAERLEALTQTPALRAEAAVALALHDAAARAEDNSPWSDPGGWRMSSAPRTLWRFEDREGPIEVDITRNAQGWRAACAGEVREFEYAFPAADSISASFDPAGAYFAYFVQAGADTIVSLGGDTAAFAAPGARRDLADGAASDEVKAPLPGKIVALTARTGQSVKKGDPLVTLEAMKMEHALKAPRDGVIADIAAETGAQVKEGAVLVRLEAADE